MLQLKDQTTFFQSSIVQFWWVRIVASSVSCSYLTEVPLFNVWCVVCSEMIFHRPRLLRVLIWVTVAYCIYQLEPLAILFWPLASTRHFRPQNCSSLHIFWTILCECVKIRSFRNRPALLAPTTFLPHSHAQFELCLDREVLLISYLCILISFPHFFSLCLNSIPVGCEGRIQRKKKWGQDKDQRQGNVFFTRASLQCLICCAQGIFPYVVIEEIHKWY